jgi:hypothetical protein
MESFLKYLSAKNLYKICFDLNVATVINTVVVTRTTRSKYSTITYLYCTVVLVVATTPTYYLQYSYSTTVATILYYSTIVLLVLLVQSVKRV